LDYQEKYISAQDGLQLYARDYRPLKQTARSIICLSGLTRNSKDFDGFASSLKLKGHRVVSLDYRGRGKSDYDTDWTNYHPRIYASDIFHVLSALGLHGCTMVGTSLGGIMSMVLCVSAPGLVHSLILNDVGPDLDEGGLAQIISYTGNGSSVVDLAEAVKKMKSHYPDHLDFEDKDWRDIAQKTYKLDNGHYIPDWDIKIAENLKESSASEERKDLWPFFGAIGERPTLVLRGESSSVFKRETFDKMLNILPNISGVEIKGVGHAPTLEEPSSQSAVYNFLARNH